MSKSFKHQNLTFEKAYSAKNSKSLLKFNYASNSRSFKPNESKISKNISYDSLSFNCYKNSNTQDFDESILSIHRDRGLPHKFHEDSIISMVFLKKERSQPKFFSFPEDNYINFKGINGLKIRYDFPKYDKNSIEGYSMFYANSERKNIIRISSDFQHSRATHDIQKNSLNTPKPKRSNFFCFICNQEITEFQKHLSDLSHVEICEKNSELYKRIESNFLQIRENNNNSGIFFRKKDENLRISKFDFQFNTLFVEDRKKEDNDIYYYLKKKRKIQEVKKNKRKIMVLLIQLGLRTPMNRVKSERRRVHLKSDI